jgi:hypothetical protein
LEQPRENIFGRPWIRSTAWLIELAEAAGVTKRTVQRLEIGGEQHIAKKLRHGHVSGEVWAKLVAALKRHGVELLPESDEHGAGVRWRFPRAQRPQN